MSSASDGQDVTAAITFAQQQFARLLGDACARGITEEQYVRYLSVQYHLTKGVQEYFYMAAGHHALRRRNDLRRFLVEFGNEEESHYQIAAKDLEAMGRELLPEPFDVALWHAYFKSVVAERPFLRIGATCVLENVSGGEAAGFVREAMGTSFLNSENSRFLRIHQHEAVPHGAQILDVLAKARLSAEEQGDLAAGAWRAAVLYTRITRWAVDPDVPDVPPVRRRPD